MLRVAEEVREALAAGGPVVALETTIVAHGFPPGEGLRVGRECEALGVGRPRLLVFWRWADTVVFSGAEDASDATGEWGGGGAAAPSSAASAAMMRSSGLGVAAMCAVLTCV